MSIVKAEPRVALLSPEIERAWRGAEIIPQGTTRDELDAFAATCARLGLDPLAKQVYLVRRWDQQLGRERCTTQVSIDGFRVVAERTREYRGQTAPEWCGPDGKWRDAWLEREPPAAARIGVHREGYKEPLVRVARFASYAQKNRQGQLTRMWALMPDVMLAKCAEALALRAAFPNELGGLYTADETAQTESPLAVAEAAQAPAQNAPKALPAPEGVPPDEGRREARGASEDFRVLLELYRGKLTACTTQDELRAWIDALQREPLSAMQRGALWGAFCQHVTALGFEVAQFRKGGK